MSEDYIKTDDLGFTLVFAMVLLMLLPSYSTAQTFEAKHQLSQVHRICVTWPRGNSQEAQQERNRVAQLLEKQGHRTVDCTSNPNQNWDTELFLYPVMGTYEGTTSFYSTFATSSNTVTGSAIVVTPRYAGTTWTFSLWPRGEPSSIYRDSANSVETGIKRLSKSLKKSQTSKPH